MNITRATCIYCDILLATVEADDELEAEGHTPQLDGAAGDEVRAAAVTIRTARTYLATDHEGADCPHRELIGE